MDRQFALDSRRGTISIIPLLVIGEKTEARQSQMPKSYGKYDFSLCTLIVSSIPPTSGFLVGPEVRDVAGLRLVHTPRNLLGEKSSLAVDRNPWMYSFPFLLP